MSQPRILIVENSIAVTGALQSIIRSSLYLKNHYDVVFLIPRKSQVGEFLNSKGFQFHQLPMREIRKNGIDLILYLPFLFINTLRFALLVKKEKVDLIVVNDFYNLIPSIYKWWGGQLPYITYVRFLPSRFSRWLVKFWMAFHTRYASSIIVVSEAVKRELPKSDSIFVVYNELPSEEVAYTVPVNKIILYPANYIRGKGQEYALLSFARIHKQFPEWIIRFVGGDMGLEKNRKFKDELMAQAQSLGLESQVEWLGFASQMSAEYEQASVVINFSESESFSLTCLEGLFHGRPVIATRCGGPEEIIDHNLSGLLVPVGDVPAMAEAMSQLLKNPAQIEEMGRKGYQTTRTKFSRSTINQRLDGAYIDALKSRLR